MDRFSRFKLLRALWARARALLAWLHVPQQQQLRARMQYWQHVNSAERQIRDGIVRATGDPDSYVRPPPPAQQEGQQAWQAWQAARTRRQLDEAQRLWVEQQHRNGQYHQQRRS